MKKLRPCMVLAAVLLLSLFSAPSLMAEGPEGVLAVVNGEEVRQGDYRLFLLKMPSKPAGEGVDRETLRALVEERLILQEARKRGIAVSEEAAAEGMRDVLKENDITEEDLMKELSSRGVGMDEYRKWLRENVLVLAKMVREEVDDKVTMEDAEIEDYYDRNSDLFRTGPERARVRAIFLRLGDRPTLAEVTALKIKVLRIVSALRRGTSFETVMSLHPESALTEHGGLLGDFREGELVPPLDRQVLSLEDGGVSDPVWLREGVYILKLEGRMREAAPFREARADARRMLFREKRNQIYREWARALWERSSVTIY